MLKFIKKYSTFLLYTLLLASMLLTALQITGMEPLEQTKNHQAPPTQFMILPDELPSMIIAASKNQQALSETCQFIRNFIANNKETILRQGLLQLNEKALEKFLLRYGSLGNGTIVENLLAKGSNPNAFRTVFIPRAQRLDPAIIYKQIPLIFDAIENGHTNIVQLLITHGVDIKAQVIDKKTPLHYACEYKNPNVVRMLLMHGADINTQDLYRNTPLHCATRNRDNEKVVTILLGIEQVQVNTKSLFGETPLHNACLCECAQVVTQLLKKEALVDSRNGNHDTPLHVACTYGWAEIVEILLNNGADIHAMGNDGSPLHSASKYGRIEVVKKLLERGARVNQRDIINRTPLSIAIYQSEKPNEEVKKLLIAHGGETNGFMHESPWAASTVLVTIGVLTYAYAKLFH